MAKGKITLQMLSEMMANNSGRSKSSVEAFVRVFFTTLKDALQTDNIVKIKGFGTFKLVVVSARESVNVNNGERVNIAGYNKITFTPDKTLKDRINRPFANFDTMVLEDDDVRLIEGIPSDRSEMAVEEPVAVEEPASVKPEETLATPAPAALADISEAKEELPQAEEKSEEPAAVAGEESPSAVESELPKDEQNSADDEPELAEPKAEPAQSDSKPAKAVTAESAEAKSKRGKRNGAIIAVLLVALLAVAAFLLIPRLTGGEEQKETEANKVAVQDSIAKAAAMQAEQDSVAQLRLEADKYEQVDDGDYVIVGVQARRKVRGGLTLQRMCRRIYGTDEYVPYVLKLNNMKSPSEAWAGRIISFPKLEKKDRLYGNNH